MDTNSNELNYVKNIVPVLIENKKCLVILDSQTELKCKMDYALDYVLLDTYITPGVMTVSDGLFILLINYTINFAKKRYKQDILMIFFLII